MNTWSAIKSTLSVILVPTDIETAITTLDSRVG